jgi:hypothetical protein
MASWLSDQWKQIRGHVKYEVLKAVVLALAGSGIIAALGAILHRVFQGINADWFVFGAIFCCSFLVFVIALLRPSPKQKERAPSNRLKIDSLSETVRLGSLWRVPTDIYFNLSIELLEIANENEVTIELTSGSVHYLGG